MRSLGWALIQPARCPYKKRLGHRHIQREDHVRTQGEDRALQAKERVIGRSLDTLTLDFLSPEL